MTIMVSEIMSDEKQPAPIVGQPQRQAASMVGHTIVAAEWHPAQWRKLNASLNVQETVERLVLVLDDGRRIEIEPWGVGGSHGLSFGPEVTDSRQ